MNTSSPQHPIVQVPGVRNPYETYHSQGALRSIPVHGDHDLSPSKSYSSSWVRFLYLPSSITEIVGNAGTWCLSWAFITSISLALPAIIQTAVGFAVLCFFCGLGLALRQDSTLMPLVVLRMVLILVGCMLGVLL